MNTPTYKEQFDKITRAYIADELQPTNSCACFIGNLLNNNREWAMGRVFDWKNHGIGVVANEHLIMLVVNAEANGLYSAQEIVDMEDNFLSIYSDGFQSEDALFHAMESTLEMLKQIHISKGEQVDPIPFAKRQLC